MEDILLDSLFALPSARSAAALRRLRPGALWTALLPGADAATVLSLMGNDGPATLALAVALLPDPAAAVAASGYPFPWKGTSEDLSAALVSDGIRMTASRDPAPHGSFRVEVRHRTRAEWEASVMECLEEAELAFLRGNPPDALDALLTSSRIDLRPFVGTAGVDDRLRFALSASVDVHGPDVRCYFRRSAAAGLVLAIAHALEAFPVVSRGRHECGWPAWCETCGDDRGEAEARVPSHVLGSSLSVTAFGPDP